MPENFEMQADFSIFVRMDNGEIIIYRTADGETRLEVRMENDCIFRSIPVHIPVAYKA